MHAGKFTVNLLSIILHLYHWLVLVVSRVTQLWGGWKWTSGELVTKAS